MRIIRKANPLSEWKQQPPSSLRAAHSLPLHLGEANQMRLLCACFRTNASSTELPSNEESSLNELVSKIIVTDDKVAKVVKAMQAEQISPPQRPSAL